MESRLSLGRSAAIRFLDGLDLRMLQPSINFDYRVEQVQDFSSGRDLAPMAFGLRAKGMTALYDAIVHGAKLLPRDQSSAKRLLSSLTEWTRKVKSLLESIGGRTCSWCRHLRC